MSDRHDEAIWRNSQECGPLEWQRRQGRGYPPLNFWSFATALALVILSVAAFSVYPL